MELKNLTSIQPRVRTRPGSQQTHTVFFVCEHDDCALVWRVLSANLGLGSGASRLRSPRAAGNCMNQA